MAEGDRYHHGDLPRALLAAATEVIAEGGPAGLSLREVARRAGVSHAAPQHHFGDKAGLLTALAVEGFEHLSAALDEAAEGVDDPAERLVRLGRGYVGTALRHPAHCAVMWRADLLHDDDPRLTFAAMAAFERLHATVVELRDVHNPDLDADSAAFCCWSMVQGLVELAEPMAHVAEARGFVAPGKGPGPEDLAEHLTRMMLAGFAPTVDAGSAATGG